MGRARFGLALERHRGAQHATRREPWYPPGHRGGVRAADSPARCDVPGGARFGGRVGSAAGGSAAVHRCGTLAGGSGRGADPAARGGVPARGARHAGVPKRIDPGAGVLCGGGAGEAALASERGGARSEEHTSELQSHSNTSYAVFCLKKKKKPKIYKILLFNNKKKRTNNQINK